MQKVLIIGPNFFEINKSIADAFTQMGWTTYIESYDNPIHPFKGWTKWQHKFFSNKEKLRERSRINYASFIARRFDEIQPELVFIYNGDILLTHTLDYFRRKAKVAIWMLDSVNHYPLCKNHIDHVDAFFCFEQEDVNMYINEGKQAYFLPQACDSNVYFPLECKKDIDILFVGNLYGYQKRIQYLKGVIKAFPNNKILIYGVYKPYYKNPLKCLFRERRDIYMNKNVPRQGVNLLYNRAKVVLNIHHEQSQNGANPKVFEICGSGAYQVCDKNPYISALFPDNQIALYGNQKELIDCIADALKNDKANSAKAAQALVYSNHTFSHRISEALNVLHK
ncbi:MAG: glycosyltransferase [Paludibacteraceae bacterium]|nr:glycosyltransferase [Paludibacteraceae bacterium]